MVSYKVTKNLGDKGTIYKSLESAREARSKKHTRKGYATFGIYKWSKKYSKWYLIE